MAGALSCVGRLGNLVVVQSIADLSQKFIEADLTKQRGIVDDLILLIELHIFFFHQYHQLLIVLATR